MAESKTLGPWPKGLNLTSNRDLSLFLGNDELGEATNVVFTPEGFVQPRPGCRRYQYDFGPYDTIQAVGNLTLPTGETVVIVQTITGNQAKLWKVTDKTTVSELPYTPTAGIRVNHILSYSSSVGDNHSGVFFFTDSANSTFKNKNLDLSGTAADYVVIQSLGAYNVPASHKGFIVKDRLFLFDYDKSTMWWSPANFIMDFNKVHSAGIGGSGDDVFAQEPIDYTIKEDGFRAVEFHNNNFYIFKKTKAYLFTYQALPLEDGYLRKISDDMGAFDSTLFRGNVVVINRKGVFRLDGSEFIDLQRRLNFRFELPMDHSNVIRDNIFITDFNEDIVFGFRDVIGGKSYYYCMNGNNGAWSEWRYDYAGAVDISSPGSDFFRSQNKNSTKMIQLFTTFGNKYLVYMDYKPDSTLPTYHMDSDNTNIVPRTYYIPSVGIKTAAMFSDSPLRFFKIYRTYIRFYMSDIPQEALRRLGLPGALWTISLNYNDYKFQYDAKVDGNPIFSLYPSKLDFFEHNLMEGSNVAPKTAVYLRNFQIPIPQQRAKEVVIELSRVFTALPAAEATVLVNPDADRPIKNGYYFMFSSVWVDYQTKQRI